jgi:hypothetical protein
VAVRAGAGAFPWEERLDLRAGEWVEVRSKEEILRTLDKEGCLRGMPFMPEMLAWCGQRLRVDSRAERLCDTILTSEGRKLLNTVHLEGIRCDGSAHGGCQASCLTWWREAWLKRVDDPAPPPSGDQPAKVTEEGLHRLTERRGYISATLYSCQVTRLREFSHGQHWFDPRPVWRSIKYGNVSVGKAADTIRRAALNVLRRLVGARPVPDVRGRLKGSTPKGTIPGLQPGDWVMVKSKEEIETTLDRRQRNRGLLFDVEMLPYCGRPMRLLKKVDRIIDERTGAMRSLPNDCWIMEGAVCQSFDSRRRLFCTRKIFSYWREVWFEGRVDPPRFEAPKGP